MGGNLDKYALDFHGEMLLEEYRSLIPALKKIQEIVDGELSRKIAESGIMINAIESRIKTESSLAGKLRLKGGKYKTIYDLTDLMGARVITFYSDEVDKISAMVDRVFTIDWENSVDKRKMHQLNSFGYNSLHYICSIPKELYYDPQMPQINEVRFELQMRTALQHVWATMYHDTGYKSGVEVPVEYIRNLNRLAGMLELADEQFSLIRTNINDYRRRVQNLVSDGRFDEVSLDGDTFSSYLDINPFDKLTKKIAAVNQAEILDASYLPYLAVFKWVGFKTLQDVQNLIHDYSDDAYSLAVYELGNTDLDIISGTLALQDLITVYILENGGGIKGLETFYNMIYGESAYNEPRARRLFESASNLSFMNKKNG